MKTKIISLLLMVVLCLNLAMSVSAAKYPFVLDFLGVLSEAEVDTLDEMAAQIYEDTGMGVFFVYDTAPDLQEYNYTVFTADLTDYYIMVENEDSWYYFAGGKCEQLDTNALRDAYDTTETYVDGVEAFLAEAFLQITFLDDGTDEDETTEGKTTEDEATESEPTEENLLVWDEAELLSEAEASELNGKLESLSEKYKAEIRVVTISSLDGGNIDTYLNYLYDGSDFGYGDKHDGVLLLVSMDIREYRILSNGFAGEAITSSDIDSIGDAITSDMSDGNYAAAFDTFADKCEYYLNGYINGFPFDVTTSLLVALGVGLLVAVIGTTILKGQLKSVRKQAAANAYVKPGTMKITQSGDYFMYRNVTKTEKQSRSSSGSSGGGSSRSTGGGKF